MTQKEIDSIEILLINDHIPYISPNIPVQDFSLITVLIRSAFLLESFIGSSV